MHVNGSRFITVLAYSDLKPENLLLDYNNNIKIVDFGLSNTYKPSELLKTACGSPCYAAPEMIAGKYYVPNKVDIWSSGIILFALVCGYLPFEDASTANLYKKILAGEFSIPKFVSSKGRDLMKRILDTNPETRYSFEEISAHPWFQQIVPEPEISHQLLQSTSMQVVVLQLFFGLLVWGYRSIQLSLSKFVVMVSTQRL